MFSSGTETSIDCRARKPGKIESSIDLPHQRILLRHRAETGRKAALVRSSAVPSWLAPTKISVSKMGSQFAASLNGLLQQNLPTSRHFHCASACLKCAKLVVADHYSITLSPGRA